MEPGQRRRVPNREQLVWRALGDPTRRAILDLLREGPRSTGELALCFATSRYSVMKHLGILFRAGLLSIRKEGRTRWNHLNAVPLQQLYERWVRPFDGRWAGSMLAIKDAAERGHAAERTPQRGGEVMGPALNVIRLEMEVPIAAPIDFVWKVLTEQTDRWWHRDMHVLSEPLGMVLEPQAGGRLYERGADGSEVLWGTVSELLPGKSISITGHLTPKFGGPAVTMYTWALEAVGGHTLLRLSDCVMGKVDESLAESLESGWSLLFNLGFKPFVESAS